MRSSLRYRSFTAGLPAPALDHEVVRRLMNLVERRNPGLLAFVASCVLALMFANLYAACAALREFQFGAAARGLNIGSAWVVGASVVGLALLMLPAPAGAMLVRDWWLRRLVHARVTRMDCVFCSYPLQSLESKHEIVRCPECGTAHRDVGACRVPEDALD